VRWCRGSQQIRIVCAQILGELSSSRIVNLGGDEFAQSDPILAAAGIGVINSDPVTTSEFATPNGVAATGGVPTSLGALVKYFATVKHYKSIAFTGPDGIGAQIQGIVQLFATPYKMTVTPYLFPETTTDYTATATALAASKADVIIGASGVSAVGPILSALKEAANTIPVAFFDTSITPAAITEAGLRPTASTRPTRSPRWLPPMARTRRPWPTMPQYEAVGQPQGLGPFRLGRRPDADNDRQVTWRLAATVLRFQCHGARIDQQCAALPGPPCRKRPRLPQTRRSRLSSIRMSSSAV